MAKQCYVTLSRRDTAMASYFPGFELKNSPEADWVDTVLVPALLRVVKKSKKINLIPVTFWGEIRGTARHAAEIFLFTTPANALTLVEKALTAIPECVKNNEGHIRCGQEYLPENAVPICQAFRNKVIRFYVKLDEDTYYLPVIRWEDRAPVIALAPLKQSATLIKNEDAELLPMRVDISDAEDGNLCRKFQQALSGIGVEDED